jgi:hypothetical protein
MMKPAKNTICLWYDGDAEDAARFYAKTFPDSSVGAMPGHWVARRSAIALLSFYFLYRSGYRTRRTCKSR